MCEDYHYRFGMAGEGQADIIQSYLERDPGQVLNIGCGPCRDKIWRDKILKMAAYCDFLVAADHCIGAVTKVEVNRRNVGFLVADAERIPLGDGSMHHIVALGLFAEIENPAKVLSEFHRVCRLGGHVMITNAVRHSEASYIELSGRAGFGLVERACGYCPVASGRVKERYLLVLEKG